MAGKFLLLARWLHSRKSADDWLYRMEGFQSFGRGVVACDVETKVLDSTITNLKAVPFFWSVRRSYKVIIEGWRI